MVSHILAVLYWELISVFILCQIPTDWMKDKQAVKRLSLQPCLLLAFIALGCWRVNCVLLRFQTNIEVVYTFYHLLLIEENKNLCKQVISPTCTPVKINKHWISTSHSPFLGFTSTVTAFVTSS